MFSRLFKFSTLQCLTVALSVCALGLTSCGSTNLGCGTESGRAAIVKAVDNALNTQDCTTAVTVIEPFFSDPGCATDEIRYSRASAYACAANVNFFRVISDLTSGDVSSGGVIQTITKIFPSTATDSKVIAAEYALDALFSVRVPGSITPPRYLINTSTPHPGTLVPSHRKDDANLYGIFTSMALMGALQNRYGNPDGTYERQQKLGATSGNAAGWEDPTAMTEDGCAYAAATLTFIDNIGDVGAMLGSKFGGSLSTQLSGLGTFFSSAFDTQCATECAACGHSCTSCPISLRYRGSCSVLSSSPNEEACAAAGIIKVMNLGWPSNP